MTTINNAKAYFYIAIVEGQNDYYQIFLWTTAERKIRFENKIQQIIYSFREISTQKKTLSKILCK